VFSLSQYVSLNVCVFIMCVSFSVCVFLCMLCVQSFSVCVFDIHSYKSLTSDD